MFRFVRGPLFANIVLADEINRTPPKTQAALLQAMQEYRVTAGGQTHALPLPFLVFATQNPIEQEGTYPLPEAQLDRFMFQIDVGYPSAEEEVAHRQADDDRLPAGAAQGARRPSGSWSCRSWCCACRWPTTSSQHAVALVRATRPDRRRPPPTFIRENVSWGAGPRASQYLILAPRRAPSSTAATRPSIEDVRALAQPMLHAPHLPQLPRRGRRRAPRASLIDRLLEPSVRP